MYTSSTLTVANGSSIDSNIANVSSPAFDLASVLVVGWFANSSIDDRLL